MSVATRRPAAARGRARGKGGTRSGNASRGRATSARRRPATSRRRRPTSPRRLLLLGGSFTLVVGLMIVMGLSSGPSRGLVCVDAEGRPLEASATIAGYGSDQLANAKSIVNAGESLNAPRTAQIIAVMTAMGESGLRVLDHGDSAGPDSRGLFQQRDNGAWGSYDDRMDPTISADSFYRELLETPGWESMEPTIAAHEVQGNSDERHYERWYTAAVEVVDALTVRSLECGGDGPVPVPSSETD